ncbi:segregation and condensation protein B [Bradyrhizobium sp. USDA 4341]
MASLAEVRRDEPEEEVSPMDHPVARPEELRLLEALLFASAEPIDQATLAKRMPDGVDIKVALAQLQAEYAPRGVNLVRVANKWTFRTAGDLSWLMTRESTETRKLSRAAIEVLSIVAYHQPVTRAEIEEIRGVVTSKGTIDVLLETGWIRPRGRRKTPGRPLTFGTTDAFLSQFSLEALGDLPGLEELKGTGLLDSRLPTGFSVPSPSDDATLREDEEPLEPGDTLELLLAPAVEPEAEEPKTDSEAVAEVEAAEVGAAEVETTAEAETDLEAEVAAEVDTAEPDAAEPDADEPDERIDHAGDDDGAEEKGE